MNNKQWKNEQWTLNNEQWIINDEKRTMNGEHAPGTVNYEQ